jgi:uncharacterized protein YbjT (DUF2867 family)
MKNLAIIGSTGMLGKPVTKELINAGFDVTLLVRDVNKAKKIFGEKIKLVKGDLKDSTSLETLMKGQDGLYLNLSVEQKSKERDFLPEREGLMNILQAAKKTGIKRIGYLSSLWQAGCKSV